MRTVLASMLGFGVFVLLTVLGFEWILRSGIIDNSLAGAAIEVNGARKRLAIVGDSFTSNEFHSELKRRLANELPGVSAVNFSEPGMGVLSYLCRVRNQVRSVQPSHVLISVYAGNDIYEELPDFFRDLATVDQRCTGWHFWRKLRQRYYQLVDSDRLAALAAKARFFGIDDQFIQAMLDRKINGYLLETSLRNQQFYFESLGLGGRYQSNVEVLKEGLRRIITEVRSMQAKPLLVIYPHVLQVNGARDAFFEKLHAKVSPKLRETRALQDNLLQFCQSERVNCIDLLPHLKRQAKDKHYWPNDDHFSREGVNLVLDFLLPHLKNNI